MNGETQEHKGLQPTPIHVTARFEDRDVGIQLPHWGLELTLNDAKELHRHLEACLRGCDEALDGKTGPQRRHVGVGCSDGNDDCIHFFYSRPQFAWGDLSRDEAEQLLERLSEELQPVPPVTISPSLVVETGPEGGVDR
jgi:hypothetical protein